MTYTEAIQYLKGLQVFGANFSLETPRRLAAAAGDPQTRLRFIHVAGTNGKGSVCAMLESIYRAAGGRVGLFTSPHLVSFRERLQVNRRLISEVDVAQLVAEIQPLVRELPADQPPTFFEFVTVMALKYFAEQRCDLVIWETGLGGRLDATNIVTPLASVITNIALDHQPWLGDTLEEIAAEKAGIIKPGVPVITGADQPEVLRVMAEAARKNAANLTPAHASAATPEIPLLGEHQRQNATLALAVVAALQSRLPVTAAQIQTGLTSVNWPGRLQLIQRGAQKILLDGAHNVAGAATLQAALRKHFAAESLTLILGALGDKDWLPMCDLLAPLAQIIFTVPVSSPRSAAPQELAAACRKANPAARVTAADSLAAALRETADASFVVVAGSLYLVGEALEKLQPESAAAGERGLNDWTGTEIRR